jgi:hypothetical protein
VGSKHTNCFRSIQILTTVLSLSPLGSHPLAKALRTNGNLKRLHLCSNLIEDAGSLYTILIIHCTHCTIYSYTVLTIHFTHTLYSHTVLTHCTHNTLYSLYNILIHCTHYTLYSHTVLTHCTHTLYSLYTLLTHCTHNTLYSHTVRRGLRARRCAAVQQGMSMVYSVRV